MFLRLSLAMLFAVPLPPLLAAGAEAWQPLFNGKDMTGWKHVGDGAMVVKDGAIATSGKGMGLLYWTGGKVGKAQIRIVYRTTDKPGNSGVFIRIPLEPREAWMPVHYGYEVNIESDPSRWNEDDYYGTGSLYSFTKILQKADKPGPHWNEMIITIDGPRTVVHVNGIKVTDYKEGDPLRPPHKGDPKPGPRPDEGWVGLQNEGEPVYFKEISMRPLPR